MSALLVIAYTGGDAYRRGSWMRTHHALTAAAFAVFGLAVVLA